MSDQKIEDPDNSNKMLRALFSTIGTVPFAGGVTSAITGYWSEKDQEKVNGFFKNWIEMLKDEIKEKEKTIIEILKRLDLQDEKISKRIQSVEYQSLLKKTFRDWSGAESNKKQIFIKNILSNAASSEISSDDVVKMFLSWIDQYSELHFLVIGAICNKSEGISRGEIWDNIGKKTVREDSADAVLYKLLIRDLSTGGIIHQYREVDYHGNPIPKQRQKKSSPSQGKSFDRIEKYVLTELGRQFVHYAMEGETIKIEDKNQADQ